MDKDEYRKGERVERPETLFDQHRPPGSPQPREIKSQQAQLRSKHRHDVQKNVRLDMEYKTGRNPEHKDLSKPS